ncbi:hypothetical protein SFRURICE_015814 [Spodoptera frugiperda]|nr:hypothetical protein SFRURICE_015814 [Spodoptera frugiperda]
MSEPPQLRLAGEAGQQAEVAVVSESRLRRLARVGPPEPRSAGAVTETMLACMLFACCMLACMLHACMLGARLQRAEIRVAIEWRQRKIAVAADVGYAYEVRRSSSLLPRRASHRHFVVQSKAKKLISGNAVSQLSRARTDSYMSAYKCRCGRFAGFVGNRWARREDEKLVNWGLVLILKG